VQDVMVTAAVLLEIALVIPGRRYRLVDERQARDDLVVEPWMTNADDPRRPAPVADDSRVAAGVKHRVPNAVLAQDRRAPLDGIALRDAAEIDPHAGLREADRERVAIEDHVPPADGRKPRADLLVARTAPRPEVVEEADAIVGDIECPAA